MKLPQLLSIYLYKTRQLDLPGIGSFTLDADAVIPQESDRIGQVTATGIRFRNAVVRTADEDLVNFIKEHTGKMKSLAAADLDFYLTTGRQLLNIGKPFYLEGIGTLIKNKEGQLEFTPGEYMVARLEEQGPERRGAGVDEPGREREVQGNSTKQGLLLFLIIVGLGVIGWGGYYLYKRNSFSEPSEKQAVVLPDTTKAEPARGPGQIDSGKTEVKDSIKPGANTGTAGSPEANGVAASTATNAGTAGSPGANGGTATNAGTAVSPEASGGAAGNSGETSPPPGATLYRFVILSTDNKHHALRRYNQLLGYQLNIKLDQKDSSWFKLYFPISARPKDTTYIKDSLSDTYAAPKVIIEH
ncbi:MAG TPA: hypothetical protein VFE32_00790 [Puia sp.]|jgi:hypothetical protein|nr:hypothetical protein [Puia sp.]